MTAKNFVRCFRCEVVW